jgi:hypothetical protein
MQHSDSIARSMKQTYRPVSWGRVLQVGVIQSFGSPDVPARWMGARSRVVGFV